MTELIEDLKSYISDAYGDGYDTVEIPIDMARDILAELQSYQTYRAMAAGINRHDEALEKVIGDIEAQQGGGQHPIHRNRPFD